MAARIKKVAAFVDTLAIHLCKDTIQNVELVFVAARGSKEAQWAKTFLPKQRLLLFELDTTDAEELAQLNPNSYPIRSNLAKVLRSKGIEALIYWGVVTPKLKGWSQRNKIRLVTPAYKLQRLLGNKLSFHSFCKENKIPVPDGKEFIYSKDKRLPFPGRTVLQIADSMGGLGTFFVESDADIKNLVRERVLKRNKKYLAREFASGVPYGITVFISPERTIISAARRQCFFNENTQGNRPYAGLQWVPSSELSKKAVRNINSVFTRLARKLYKLRYFGFANFDFILDKQQRPLLIECNPRLSCASPQLIRYPELASGFDLGKLFIEGFFKARRYIKNPAVFAYPISSYRGSSLEILAHPKLHKEEVELNYEYKAGIYERGDGGVRFKNPDIARLECDNNQLLFYSDVKSGEKYRGETEVGIVLANFPLFNRKGRINRRAEKLIERFSMC